MGTIHAPTHDLSSPSHARRAQCVPLSSETIVRGAGCLSWARPELREPRVGNCPRPPGLRQAKPWRGGCHELKTLTAVQRVRLPPGKGAARQPEASLAWRAATPVVKRRQQVMKRRAASKSVKR